MNSDRIRLKGIEAEGIIGWFDDERNAPQRLVIDLEFETVTHTAAQSDDLKDTIDFDVVFQVRKLVETSSYRLVESLAEALAHLCLKQPMVRMVTVTVTKVPAQLGGVEAQVKITRP
jgi:dihydroneopterin aldolase